MARSNGLLMMAAVIAVAVSGTMSHGDALDLTPLITAEGGARDGSTVVIKRLADGQTWISNPKRADIRYSPASTAKIPHTLIALETGIAAPDTVFAWDGIPRARQNWNEDQTLAAAFERSTVWAYQAIAQRAGTEVMAAHLTAFMYGNGTVGGPKQLGTYWLDGTLKISASEQIEFLSKLADGSLPVSETTRRAARDIFVSDRGPGWVMQSKTGWHFDRASMDIGWFVGTLTCRSDTYVFALNMDMPDTRYLVQRTRLMYAALKGIGAFDCA